MLWFLEKPVQARYKFLHPKVFFEKNGCDLSGLLVIGYRKYLGRPSNDIAANHRDILLLQNEPSRLAIWKFPDPPLTLGFVRLGCRGAHRATCVKLPVVEIAGAQENLADRVRHGMQLLKAGRGLMIHG